MLDHMEYTYSAEASAEAETYSSTTPSSSTMRKKKNKNTKRFSDEQIKSLESVFEKDSRLEPRKKLQLARELGLHPKQVAIWFQNRRARWKSKQLERDYNILRSNYDNLASKFEALKKEKQALLVQLQKVKDIIDKRKPQEQAQSSSSKQVKAANSMVSEAENGDTSIKLEYFGIEEEPGLLNFFENPEGSLTSPEEWSTFDSDDLLAQSTSDLQWWDFWS
ncbi:hypothetical protein TanjilG_05583 [Lupinus angustifolius]|uniref:Homeobox-leucine zipper protein n=1 Tax=Lupinus angustifolius TaxID=3871 RepID=A0A4P1QSK1_LUPAN|nr:PREDICTED: homeobox-leucine zipper protein ATHB-12-like [Lupinus angustifolius]XP_019420838.1 PREDICTED: homeobox-leucine zipper protein ATHB-12-like [Lupinus angustifolius]OIV93880.1 hypothetical protein TanjilG_05583 [Lupinus angustifolius]